MIRVSTIFVAMCMVLIAATFGFLLYRIVGLSLLQAFMGGLGILGVLAAFNGVSSRLREKSDLSGQISDLAIGTADLAKQVAEFGRRLQVVENRMGPLNGQLERRVDPLKQEIAELGLLMKQIAISVAEHDERLTPGASDPLREAVSASLLRETIPLVHEPAAAQAATVAPEPSVAPASIVTPLPPITVVPQPPKAASPITAAKRVVREQPVVAQTSNAAIGIAPLIREAVEAGRIDLYLQPMVTLPQRKVRFYEAMARLRDGADNVIAANEFVTVAEDIGVMPHIDEAAILRCIQVLRRLTARNKDIGLFCNVSSDTLRDKAVFTRCLDFLDANRALASSLVLEFKHSTFRSLGFTESENLAALAKRGFRFSVDHVIDLRLDAKELADRGVKFLKIPATLLLDPARSAGSDIQPSDLSDMLSRFGIDLIAERIEGERAVVDLLDYDVRFGQGFLFAPPRPLRPEAATVVDNPEQSAPSPVITPPANVDVADPASSPKARGIAALLARRAAASN